ncbi:thiolase family protein [Patulibacter sp.]|uniref:thiolase family protein n=1 Tax=Patulibacter sp. TaxID=1912859 RepID=UPI00272452D5|nr:thiolase family protein [Patulibacter sp.]MDO9409022.1 thiolase family protein [Patulibacter sp.]
MSRETIVVASAARTPFGRFGGPMSGFRLPQLGSVAAREALRRAAIEAGDVDEVIVGVNLPGSDRSIARQLALQTDVPDDRVAYSVDRACCSSLTAISLGVRALRSGDVATVVAGGVENLSRVPYFLEDMRWGKRLGHVELVDQLVISCPHTGVPRAVQAGEEALLHDVSREEQDAWAFRSQTRAAAAIERGAFDAEIIAIEAGDVPGEADGVAVDESPRPSVTMAGLAKLRTVYGSPTVTAGTAPGLSTGAAFTVLVTAADADRRGLRPLAAMLGTARVSAAPAQIASVPATAIRLALADAGKTLDDVDLIEINEAFAAVPLVSTLLLGDRDPTTVDRLRAMTNVNGGSIALGHPTGATGARLVMTMAHELRRRGGGIGVVGICGGIGEAESVVIEVVAGAD